MKQINLDDRRFAWIFILFSFLFALYFRLSFVMGADFPVNDGAMFTKIVEEILANHFRLPNATDYNFLNIPLAYPPLGFYLAAVLVKITGVQPLVMMQYLPAVLSSFTIPAFYFLGKRLFPSAQVTYLGTIIYILIPQSWKWLIMGGGLTRSLGLFFAILAVLFAYQLFTRDKKADMTWVAIFTSLTILSHPETGVFVVQAIILIFLLFSRRWKGFFKLSLAGVAVLMLTSPWWLRGIVLYGLDPFMAALGTGGTSLLFFQRILLFGITGEVNSYNMAVLAIIGFFALWADKRYFLPVWLLVILIGTPRSGPTFAMIPVSLMGSVALTDFILPVLNTRVKPRSSSHLGASKNNWLGVVLLSYLLVSLLLSGFLQPNVPDTEMKILTDEEREAMQWISENTPEDSSFILLTGKAIWNDEINEWFPYLADRYSITTLQGSEWLPDGSFGVKRQFYIKSIECLESLEDCLEPLAAKYELSYTHIYLPMAPSSSAAETQAMYLYLKYHLEYTLLYDGPGAAVFSLEQAP